MLGKIYYKPAKKMAKGAIVRIHTGDDCKRKVNLSTITATLVKARPLPQESEGEDDTTLFTFHVDKKVARTMATVEEHVLRELPEVEPSEAEGLFVSTVSVDSQRGHVFKPRIMHLKSDHKMLMQQAPLTVNIQLRVYGLRVAPTSITLVWEILKVSPVAPLEFVSDDDHPSEDDEYVCPYHDELLEDIRDKLQEKSAVLTQLLHEVHHTLEHLDSFSVERLEELRADLIK